MEDYKNQMAQALHNANLIELSEPEITRLALSETQRYQAEAVRQLKLNQESQLEIERLRALLPKIFEKARSSASWSDNDFTFDTLEEVLAAIEKEGK